MIAALVFGPLVGVMTAGFTLAGRAIDAPERPGRWRARLSDLLDGVGAVVDLAAMPLRLGRRHGPVYLG